MAQRLGSAQDDEGASSSSATSRTPRVEHSRSKSLSNVASNSEGRQARGLGAGGRATNIKSRRMRWARWAWPRMMRSERTTSGSSALASSSCARPTTTASGLLSSCPAPAANSPRASSVPATKPLLVALDVLSKRTDDRTEPACQASCDRPAARPTPPRRLESSSPPAGARGPRFRGTPQLDRGSRATLRAERQHDARRTRWLARDAAMGRVLEMGNDPTHPLRFGPYSRPDPPCRAR